MATAASPRISTFQNFSVSPMTPRIGAEIEGVYLADDLSQDVIDEIYQALLTYKVIFFRDQDITQEQHIAFARRFGDLEIHPSTPAEQPNPEVFHLRPVNWGKETGQMVKAPRYGANLWHSDVTWRETPSLGSILRGRVIPDVGGDTLWSDQVAAYEGLSPAMKEWVCSLTAVHDGSVFNKAAAERGTTFDAVIEPVEHPVVRTHPETGERALYVNCAFTHEIKGLSKKESDWLLEHLFAQAAVPEYQCRFRWRKDSIAFWDNRACQHYAAGDYAPANREMERVTIVGDKPYFDPDR
ncbi:MAG: TauD/TfdA family dioxygenase [Novosphingobium sp.]|nr:TauD/TfdA family dioxygenase [Novosphingobium sp.]